jgi:hypothetical protein
VEIWEEEKGMETILPPKLKYSRIQREMKKMVNQNVQKALKKFQDNKNKE